MEEKFVCLLTFERDENLIGKSYYYLVDFPVELGDEIVVPLGVHAKLQVGKVVKKIAEHTLPKTQISSFKYAVCPYRFRRVNLPSAVISFDLGGVFYDSKHVTAYGNFIFSFSPKGDLSSFGVDGVLYFGKNFPEGLNVPCRLFPSFTADDFFKSNNKNLLHDLFEFLSQTDGTLLFCDEFGAISSQLLFSVLYDFCGVSLGDIERDFSLVERAIDRESKQNVKFKDGCSFLTQDELHSFIERFHREYDDKEQFLFSIGLTEQEVLRLRRRMICVEKL